MNSPTEKRGHEPRRARAQAPDPTWQDRKKEQMARAKYSFDDTLEKIRTTPPGKKASMYGPIRDVFIHVLDYPAAEVDIDTSGEGGRPDVTVRAPAG